MSLLTADIPTQDVLASEHAPTDEQEKLAARIDDMVAESDELMVRRQSGWIDGLRYWRGSQWTGRKSRKKKGKQWTEAVMNRIYPMVEQKTAMLTENNPRGIFIPIESDDGAFTQDIEKLTFWRVRRMKGRSKLIRSAHNMGIFGDCAVKVFWNNELTGAADCDWYLIPPWEQIMDPFAAGIEDAEYVGTRRWVSLAWAKQQWPDAADELEKQAQSTSGELVMRNLDAAGGMADDLGQTAGQGRHARSEEDPERAPVIPMIELIELYFRDYTEQAFNQTVDFKVLEERGWVVHNEAQRPVYSEKAEQAGVARTGQLFYQSQAPREVVSERAYPEGRMVVKVGRVILEDRAWSGHWPIAWATNTPVPFKYWGLSDVEPLIEDQDRLNDFLSILYDHVKGNAHPRIKAVATAVYNRNRIRGEPDEIIWMREGQMASLEWWTPGQVSRDLYSALDLIQRNMEITTGLGAEQIARKTEGQTTATEIQIRSRASRGRIGMISSLFDEFIERLYLLTAQCIQRNYDVNRITRILGADRQQTAIEIQQGHKDVKFDVEIESGSTLPFDRQSRKQDMMALFGVLDRAVLPELLEVYNDVIQNKEEILQRDQLWQQFVQIAPLLQNPEFMQIAQQFLIAMQQEQANGQPRGQKQTA